MFIISASQNGFKANTYTCYAIPDATNYITSILDKNHLTMSTFIDLKKKFDTVDHGVLLKKLGFYGIRGISSDFF